MKVVQTGVKAFELIMEPLDDVVLEVEVEGLLDCFVGHLFSLVVLTQTRQIPWGKNSRYVYQF